MKVMQNVKRHPGFGSRHCMSSPADRVSQKKNSPIPQPQEIARSCTKCVTQYVKPAFSSKTADSKPRIEANVRRIESLRRICAFLFRVYPSRPDFLAVVFLPVIPYYYSPPIRPTLQRNSLAPVLYPEPVTCVVKLRKTTLCKSASTSGP